MRRRRLLAVASALLFLATAALVVHGTFTGFDQYAVDHWMPWLRPKHHRLIQIRTLVLPETRSTLGGTLVALWTYPASVLPSALVVGVVAWRRRSLRGPVLWIAANVVEVAAKTIVQRPALYQRGVHVTGFDHSLPSGHTLRSLVVALVLATAWRRARPAFLWALSVMPALVLLGDHTPTDVAAGFFAFLALAAGVGAVGYAMNLTFTSNRDG